MAFSIMPNPENKIFLVLGDWHWRVGVQVNFSSCNTHHVFFCRSLVFFSYHCYISSNTIIIIVVIIIDFVIILLLINLLLLILLLTNINYLSTFSPWLKFPKSFIIQICYGLKRSCQTTPWIQWIVKLSQSYNYFIFYFIH